MNNIQTICPKNNSISIIGNEVQDYINQFHEFSDKCAENILEMCKVVYDASSSLTKKGEFESFCSGIRMSKKSAAISKFRKIGERYAKLSKYKNQLPSAWTTLYYVARFDNQQFEDGIKSKTIHPMMKATDLKQIAPNLFKPSSSNGKSQKSNNSLVQPEIAIKANSRMTDVELAELIKQIQTICNKFDCELIGGMTI